MKKFITLILVFVLLFSMSGCEIASKHEHDFVYSEDASVDATCTKDGKKVYVCSCGETQEEPIAKTGHDFQLHQHTDPTCSEAGSIVYKCTKCSKTNVERLYPTGHKYEGTPTEPSRVIPCVNENCLVAQWAEDNGKHDAALTFNFTEEDEAELAAKYDEVLAMIEAGAAYDPALHGYAEEGALAEAYAVVDEAHTEYYNLILNAIAQRQLAEIAYYCDMGNTEKEETYSYMLDYYTNLISEFYTLSRPFYDSCYREFYYYGMTEEEINAYLFDSDALSNPEYTALKERNNAIEVEYLAITNPTSNDKVPTLYAEFVQNNNAMAKLMGYDNYLEYAYENVYGREYTYQHVSENLAQYVKEHISSVYGKMYGSYRAIDDNNSEHNNICNSSFFGNLRCNDVVNDYIDIMAFTTNPDKQFSFSDEFNKLMGDGNMFRGDYQGAFVTSISSANLPIAYFGRGTSYSNGFTVIHEFGHFMNEIYNGEHENISQSYDLLEMHSQGNELLFLTYLESQAGISADDFADIEADQLFNMLYSVMSGMTIDTFEQAIYLDHYEGTGADEIMADGTITPDEYDTLYANICSDFGAGKTHTNYWRYGMTITSACYYVSYSVSSLAVLQLYEMAHTQSFDAAKDAYLKLFTYTDESTEMNMEEVLEYAGMISYMDEELYIRINQFLMNR